MHFSAACSAVPQLALVVILSEISDAAGLVCHPERRGRLWPRLSKDPYISSTLPPVILSDERSEESKDPYISSTLPPVILSDERSEESKDPYISSTLPPVILSDERSEESKDPYISSTLPPVILSQVSAAVALSRRSPLTSAP